MAAGRWMACVLAVLLAPWASSLAGEQQVRSGVVTAVEPLAREAPAISRSTKRQLGGMLGRAVGQAVAGGSGHGYEARRAGGSIGSDLAGAGADGAAGASGGHVLLIRFDDASEVAFTRSADDARRFRVGSRVRVVGAGDEAILLPE